MACGILITSYGKREPFHSPILYKSHTLPMHIKYNYSGSFNLNLVIIATDNKHVLSRCFELCCCSHACENCGKESFILYIRNKCTQSHIIIACKQWNNVFKYLRAER